MKITTTCYKSILFFSIFCLFHNAAWCGWASAESALTRHSIDEEYEIRPDGSFTHHRRVRTHILKEAGRSQSVIALEYNEDQEEMLVHAATVKNGSVEEDVPEDKKENERLASSLEGFDRKRRVTIAFPNVSVGSELYHEIFHDLKTADVPGLFARRVFFGDGHYEDSHIIKFESHVPLFLHVNDPEKYLDVIESEDKGIYRIHVRLKRPIIKWVPPESEDHAAVEDEAIPFVQISTLNRDQWPEIARRMVEPIEAVLSQPLPLEYQNIVDEAKGVSDLASQINIVTSKMHELITYHGEWTTRAGRHIPRDLRVVATAKKGDCKDFSAATVAMLRQLGIEAHIAWVLSKRKFTPFKSALPIAYFNHAIVRVKAKTGESLWIDATHPKSWAHGIYSHISDRDAIVFDPRNPGRERIPALVPMRSSIHKTTRFQIPIEPSVSDLCGDGTITFCGEHASGWTGAARNAPKGRIDVAAVEMFCPRKDMLGAHRITSPDLRSSVVCDLTFGCDPLSLKNALVDTVHGCSFQPSAIAHGADALIARLLVSTKGRVSGLWAVEFPQHIHRETHLHGRKLYEAKKAQDLFSCVVTSRWFSGQRAVTPTETGAKLSETQVFNVAFIPNRELLSKEFETFQADLRRCFRPFAVNFEDAVVSASSSSSSGPASSSSSSSSSTSLSSSSTLESKVAL